MSPDEAKSNCTSSKSSSYIANGSVELELRTAGVDDVKCWDI